MAVFYKNLPGVQPTLVDGNLQIEATSSAPRVLVIGTSEKGANDTPILFSNLSEAKALFGTNGTLLRGLFEAKAQGSENVAAMRIGGTAAKLQGIGVDTATGGFTLETSLKDNEAGDLFSLFYEVSTGRLAVFSIADEDWVLDTSGVLAPERGFGQVDLTGSIIATEGTSIGSLSSPVLMSAVTGLTPDGGDAGWTFVAGTDGVNCSRMEVYEKLYDAYQVLDFAEADIIVPMDVYLDDLNVADLSGAEITALGLDTLSAYPTQGANDDALGKIFTQEIQGINYFWWDMDGDGVAEIFPSVGSASATTDSNGVTLVAADFHEVNFGYQLAEFCHRATKQWQFMIGMIPFKLPTGFSLRAMSIWIGKEPSYDINAATQEEELNSSADNGTGLLGNKFMAGRDDFRGGVGRGGFIATEGSRPVGSWMDGTEVLDENEHVVDIGKHLSVLGAVGVHTNNFSGEAYISTINASYAGMVSALRPESAPTNKVIRQLRLIRNVKGFKLDELAGMRIVSLVQKPKGVVITDAPTGARPDSDYQRLSTVRIVKHIVKRIRVASDPFIGEPNSGAQQQALQTIIETELQQQVTNQAILRYDISISSTPAQRVAGQAVVNLILVPSGELRQIPVTISLAPE
jgi:hypothetical protein